MDNIAVFNGRWVLDDGTNKKCGTFQLATLLPHFDVKQGRRGIPTRVKSMT